MNNKIEFQFTSNPANYICISVLSTLPNVTCWRRWFLSSCWFWVGPLIRFQPSTKPCNLELLLVLAILHYDPSQCLFIELEPVREDRFVSISSPEVTPTHSNCSSSATQLMWPYNPVLLTNSNLTGITQMKWLWSAWIAKSYTFTVCSCQFSDTSSFAIVSQINVVWVHVHHSEYCSNYWCNITRTIAMWTELQFSQQEKSGCQIPHNQDIQLVLTYSALNYLLAVRICNTAG